MLEIPNFLLIIKILNILVLLAYATDVQNQ